MITTNRGLEEGIRWQDSGAAGGKLSANEIRGYPKMLYLANGKANAQEIDAGCHGKVVRFEW